MEDKRCFFEGCIIDAEFSCPCSSPEIYFCKLHVVNHLEIRNKTHIINSIFIEPHEDARAAILKFLAKVDSKHKKLKEKVLASFSNSFFERENDLRGLMKEINSYSVNLSHCFKKIYEAKKISISEQDPVLGLLSLQPNEAVEKVKTIIPPNPDWYNNSKVFYGFNENIEKMIECYIENKFQNYLNDRLIKIESTIEEQNNAISLTNNELANVKDSISSLISENNKSRRDLEEWKDETKLTIENEINLLNSQIFSITEDFNQKFKEAEFIQRFASKNFIQDLKDKRSEIFKSPNTSEIEKEFRKVCSEYENDYNAHYASIIQDYHDYVNTYHKKTSLFSIYEEDNRTNLLIYNTENESKELKLLEKAEKLSFMTCMAQLPNGKLFCFGRNNPCSGITLIIDENCKSELMPSGTACYGSSAIYFNNNVYCFGGSDNSNILTLSSRFDLNSNQWNELIPLPQADYTCHSIIFNGSVLISGWQNKNLLRYSIENNSFTAIPYCFAGWKMKILINAERLYLIECENGSVYESDIGSDTDWRRITGSIISFNPDQVYCQYNKGGIYIGCIYNFKQSKYFKFNLNEKRMVELA